MAPFAVARLGGECPGVEVGGTRGMGSGGMGTGRTEPAEVAPAEEPTAGRQRLWLRAAAGRGAPPP